MADGTTRKIGDESPKKESNKSKLRSAVKTQIYDKIDHIWDELKKDHYRLSQHIFKCANATICAVIICLIPAIAKKYGPAVFLSAIATVFGHPGRNFGGMLETQVVAVLGVLIGVAWVTLASYLADVAYKTDPEVAHAIRAVFIVIAFFVHGYFRSVAPRFFVGIYLFLLGTVIEMTSPSYTFSYTVATSFLYPNLTGVAFSALINILIFPEFSSSKVGMITVTGLKKALDTLEATTDFFISPTGTHADVEESSNDDDEDAGKPRKDNESSLKALVAAKAPLRGAIISCKAMLKETSFEVSYSCIPPNNLKSIGSKGLESLVMNILTLIGACETRHIVLGPEKTLADDTKKADETTSSEGDSLKEKIEHVRPKREIEYADEHYLRELLSRVEQPLDVLRKAIRSSMHALIACIELAYDVPVDSTNRGSKPKGIPLQEIDIYTTSLEAALTDFDARSKAALRGAAEEASGGGGVEFDTLPREEIFLVSSFLLNFRLAANTILSMLKDGRKLVEDYDSRKGRRTLHPPQTKASKWFFGGGAEHNDVMDTDAQENVDRYRKTTGKGHSEDQKALLNAKDDTKRRTSDATVISPQKHAGKKPITYRVRNGIADLIDWILESPDVSYAFRLTIGAMLVCWPAFVSTYANFYYMYRGVWVVLIYILVFENSVGSSVQIFVYRTVGTIAGSAWGYAAWNAGKGNPYVIVVMLYFGFLVGYYIQLNTRYVKAGMVWTISQVIVAVGTDIGYIPGAVPGTALDNFLKRSIAMVIGGSVAVILQTLFFPVKARNKLVETVGYALLQTNEMESAIAFGVDQTTNLVDLKNEKAVRAFYKARKKAEGSLAAASAYLQVTTQEPRIKGSFANQNMIYAEIIYVMHQIIDRLENVLQLRLQLGSTVLSEFYCHVYKYRRNIAAAITITIFAIYEALTNKLPLPQFFPSARLAQLRMINRVRQIALEADASVTAASTVDATDSKEDLSTKRNNLRVEFMSYNASSAALEQVIEWLEELVDLTKLLRGAAEFSAGLLSRPMYREWIREMRVDGRKPKHHQAITDEKQALQPSNVNAEKKPDIKDSSMDDEDGLPESLKRVQSRHRETRLARQTSQTQSQESGRRNRKEELKT